ncbi:MAG TPA: ATPase, T2SS/T4P/T4SS family, partial [bacterium]|nr:ATPase, T2SS/T4P/T4SS family [bacterium]
IMVGEIRDGDTADIAVRAAITGHLVFSTIHTNTALGAVTRLQDLGVEPFMIASALIGTMSQRLVRRICEHCRRPAESEEEKFLALGIAPGTVVYRGRGCKHCRMSGYSGRIGLFELVPIKGPLRQMIVEKASEDDMTALAREQGSVDLREQGRRKIEAGITTVEEVLRVTEERE